jgi:NTP pyrophosphatase (non-canonical NTP hydrolase)
MDFSTYQQMASTTAIYPTISELISLALINKGETQVAANVKSILEDTDLNSNPYYAILGLVGEAGELANKIKKVMRDKKGEITPDIDAALKDELGDVLWYIAALATEMKWDLSAIAQANLDKLFSRKERGVLSGNGDVR